ncbi:hypothetical protein GCM10010358_76480 [Streptomyces minutiscleroticus]|uniref:Secreted protein n=2 Tax=Streptomyces minutiscleroticus TaxID=68238 RepID=A0A918P1S3_9ACTN|nr:hypothetical protein GCM10010358_76480 [Streptomyces minutiscleroticus]
MLAVASLAAGFVVAAVTPSHAVGADATGGLNLEDTLSTLDPGQTVAEDSLDTGDGLLPNG